ncbi:DUF485 domain-containing protein [Mycobacterium sp. MBM]|nr:DUF485 domain-containing protein [Mycobacterium sp. MBM]
MSTPAQASGPGRAAHRRLVMWCLAPPIVFFIGSQWLTNFTTVLNGFAVGAISWALLLAVLQFVVAIVVGFIYVRAVDRLEAAETRSAAP